MQVLGIDLQGFKVKISLSESDHFPEKVLQKSINRSKTDTFV